MADSEVTVRDNPDQHRFEAWVGEQIAGFAEYRVPADGNGDIVFTHTEVSDEYEGKGVGGALARGALDEVRRRRVYARPLCPFIAGWIRRHPDYLDLVAYSYRDRVVAR